MHRAGVLGWLILASAAAPRSQEAPHPAPAGETAPSGMDRRDGHDASPAARSGDVAPPEVCPPRFDTEIRELLAAARNGDAVRLWEQVPDVHRAAIATLVRAAAERADADQFARAAALLQRSARLLISRRQMLIGSPIVHALIDGDPDHAAARRFLVDAALLAIDELARSSLCDLEACRAFDDRAFAARTLRPLLRRLLARSREHGMDLVGWLRQAGCRATIDAPGRGRLELLLPGGTDVMLAFAFGDGRWLPAGSGERIRGWIESARAALDRVDLDGEAGTARVGGWLEVWQRHLERFEAATTPEQVDRALLALLRELTATRGLAAETAAPRPAAPTAPADGRPDQRAGGGR